MPDRQRVALAKEEIKALVEQNAKEAEIKRAFERLQGGLCNADYQDLEAFAEEAMKQRRKAVCGAVGVLDEKSLAKFIEELSRKMREEEIKREVKKHSQRIAQLIADSIESTREKKLLAFSAMGLVLATPPEMTGELSTMIKRLRAKAKDLSVPDLAAFQETPKLYEALKKELKSKAPAAQEMGAIALILAQVGVPEQTLVRLLEQKDLQGLQKLLSECGQDTPQLSINPLERIRRMAE